MEMLPDLVFRRGGLRYAKWTMKNQKLLLNFVEPMVFDCQRLKHLRSETLMQCIEAGFGLNSSGVFWILSAFARLESSS